MLKKFFVIIMILITNIAFISAVTVDVKASVFPEYTLFTYNLHFNNNDSYRSFSFEKPLDSRTDYAIDNYDNTIKYTMAGDYIIFRPEENTQNHSYEIRLLSQSISSNIIGKKAFMNYINFNFPVEKLIYVVQISEDLGEIDEIFPRDYIITQNSEIKWELSEVQSDTLFLINFDHSGPYFSESQLIYIIGWVILIALFSILFLSYFIFMKKKKEISKKVDLKPETEISPYSSQEKTLSNLKTPPPIEPKEKESSPSKVPSDETFDAYITKYLTDNEREVVNVVKGNEGISQYDILNFLPSMTKSNLSKIISKLNSKRVLNRIKVGKVNKIYLGEKLDSTISSSKSNSEK